MIILTIVHKIIQTIYIGNAIMMQHTQNVEPALPLVNLSLHRHTLCAFVCPVTSVRPIMVYKTILLIGYCDGPKSSALHCCIFPVGRYHSIVTTICHESSATWYYMYYAAFVLQFMTIIPALFKRYHFISCSSSKKARRSFCSRNIRKHLFRLNVNASIGNSC